IVNIWPEFREYEKLVNDIKFDNKGRMIIHIDWLLGKEKLRPMTTLDKTIILKRDKQDSSLIREISSEEALDYLIKHNYCNPHMLVNNEYKAHIRKQFFKLLLDRTKIFLVNTTDSPTKVNDIIFDAIKNP
ncbi:MAG: hypothetical protein ACTSQY_11045, partial [Candidatus Odinarchaeia archaeon]